MLTRNLVRLADKTIRPVGRRGYLWRPTWWSSPQQVVLRDTLDQFERHMERLDREFDRHFFGPRFASRLFDVVPSRRGLESYRAEQPIIEENGQKKFRLTYDVQHFKPEEIQIKTNGRKLSLNAKHESKEKDNEKHLELSYEYFLPEGVKPEEVECRFTSDGYLVIEAPFTPPPAIEKPDTKIAITHEK